MLLDFVNHLQVWTDWIGLHSVQLEVDYKTMYFTIFKQQ